MSNPNKKAIAIVGLGAIMPDAPDAPSFWQNIKNGKYSITEVRKERWDVNKYYDPDPKALAKSYSKIGGWIHEFDWDPIKWKMPIPPKVADMMDFTQKWAIICAREALMDYGYPNRPLNQDRTAVIMGNAMGGDLHLYSASRILYPEMEEQLIKAQSFNGLSSSVKDKIIEDFRSNVNSRFAPITEDTMSGELSNIVAGRIAALWDFKGPNYIADAACASAMAGMSAAMEGLANNYYDAVLTGGIDANMSASSYIKFCKIGALSATGTRPYSEGADGFVMGEGGAVFLLKRLSDAEKDGDKIYAVIRGIGGSSDGKGKGITAPNPRGQMLAVKNSWENAGVSPATASMIEGHGTSTKVGDAAELNALADVFNPYNLNAATIALGSVKSNLGHLKGAAGAAGIFKATMSLKEKVIPPSLNFKKPNPNIDFNKTPFFVNTELRQWDLNGHDIRRAGISAFGFGGTNFHTVLEEYIPGRIQHEIDREEKTTVAVRNVPTRQTSVKAPLQGALLIGGASENEIQNALKTILKNALEGNAPKPTAPKISDLKAPVRLAIDYQDASELADKAERALKILESGETKRWRALQGKGIFFGIGPKAKVAFLFPGQGSQYVNMLKTLSEHEEIVGQVFRDADAAMKPLIGKPLTDYIFVDDKEELVAEAEEHLKQTEITQPAVLTINTALTKLFSAYGIEPDMVMGHSLGEYSALVSSNMLSFENALKAVSARGTEMSKVSVEDNGIMAAILAPIKDVEKILSAVKGYVVIANINSTKQAVIGGETKAVQDAVKAFQEAGINAQIIPVSHAFHTKIIASASKPMLRVLRDMGVEAPKIPTISNVTGDFYPEDNPQIKEQIVDLLSKQIASPVQFVKGLNTLYEAGARVFVEVGPKRALNGFVQDVLGDKEDVLALSSNLPKNGDIASFNRALCGLFAAGIGAGFEEEVTTETRPSVSHIIQSPSAVAALNHQTQTATQIEEPPKVTHMPQNLSGDSYQQLGRLFADFMDKGMSIYSGKQSAQPLKDVCITGAALGLPGTEKVFDDQNLSRILGGEQLIKSISEKLKQEMVDKNITRLVKSDAGGPRFETIDNIADVIKLAGRSNHKDIIEDFGFPEDRIDSLDEVTILAIGAGIDAMRDAGIPLQRHYKTTSKGTQLPDRWLIPDNMRDDTGVIFASAFPGLNSFAAEMKRFYNYQQKTKTIEELKKLGDNLIKSNGSPNSAIEEIDNRIQLLEDEIHNKPYNFDRKFLFKVLSMGHSQFAEYIGARGPNTQINSACASTTMAVGIADDWIQAGRCKRVIIISADDISTDSLMGWFGAGFLASGAAATDELVENAAIPFDKRRHGMIIGMGSAALVVESKSSAAERGILPIADLLSSVIANSAYHGTRLDVDHIKNVMEDLISQAEKRWGIDRYQLAPQTVFISHETYTPARGGSASAEINALRHVFGPTADQIVIANTKGLTGHAMATGIEDVLAVKTIETGIIPPIANFKEIDPELGPLNLSKGGHYPVHYALRLGAGFGSQISMSLIRWNPAADGEHRSPQELGYTYRITDHNIWNNWMRQVSGYQQPELEVVKRTLRIKDQGPTVTAVSSDLEKKERPTFTATQQLEPQPLVVTKPVIQSGSEEKKVVNAVQEKVMQLIAEKTGYPTDMLDLELDMEADLGIDTVKQAEMFAAIREEYGIERDDNLKLREFPTIGHTIQFVYNNRPDLKPVQQETGHPAVSEPATQPATTFDDKIKDRVLELIAEKTGYPTDMLDMDLDLEADLGIDTVKQAEMFASVRSEYNIERDDNIQLRDYNTLASVVQFVYDKRPDLQKSLPSAVPQGSDSATAIETKPSIAPFSDGNAVQDRVLQIIAEKTGYPTDMLDLDLDLEADLGIDTVKQAEMFASVRGEYNIERDDNVQLRDYNTLASVIQFVFDKRPDLKQTVFTEGVVSKPLVTDTPTPIQKKETVIETVQNDAVTDKVLEVISEKTGYPSDMLDLDLDLEADLGIDTVKQAEMFAAVRGEYGIERDDNVQLRDYNTLASVIQFVYDRRPDLQKSVAAKTIKETPSVLSQEGKTSGRDSQNDAVTDKVLELISEKTGYPSDMLDLDLDLEADLGIDTVKQAEMFAAVRGEYSIEREDNVQLRDYNTLASVIQFVYDKRPDLKGSQEIAAAETVTIKQQSTTSASGKSLTGSIEAANQIPRRIPRPVLRPDLRICKATGVKLEKGSRVVIMPDQGGVASSVISRLKKQKVEVLLIAGSPTQDELVSQINTWLEKGIINGVYWLSALDKEKDISKMKLDEWREATHLRIKLLYTTMRTLYNQIGNKGTFLVSATRLGGQHGYDKEGAYAALGGSVTGFTKTFKREKPDCLVKVVDFEKANKPDLYADLLIAETLSDNGAVEIGYKNDARWTITLSEQSEASPGKGIELNKDSVFLVTGAAGSIVSAITADLAQASSGTFYLLDLAPKPDATSSDLRRFENDKENLKKDIFQRLKDSGKKATPVMVEKELTNLERMHSALTGIQAVENAGGKAVYQSLNLLDGEAIDKVIKEIKRNHGKIDVLLHAGGLEISKTLPSKEPSEFDLVFDVKSDGWFNILSSIGDMPLAAAIVFSSIAGRFGNAGQTDYSSANDFLCKSISSFRSTRKETRGIALDWTAWGGIGMAVRGSIPQIMKQAGIEMLPPEAGIAIIRRELTSGDNRGEFVVAKSLGIMMKEFDENGGLDPAKLESSNSIMTGKVVSNGLYSGLTVQTELDPTKQPFLFDHQIGDTAVLPGVMGIEAMSEAAKYLFPDMHIASISEVSFLAPFKFYKNEPRTVTVNVTFTKEKTSIIAECTLSGARKLHGQEEEQITTHFTSKVTLQKAALKAVIGKVPAKVGAKKVAAKDIYKLYFHGPAYQVMDLSWRSGKNVYGLLNRQLPANHIPQKKDTIAAPRLVELCFQTAGIIEMGTKAKMGLPSKIEQLNIYKNIEEIKKALTAVVTESKDDTFDAQIVDGSGNVYLELKGYQTMQLPETMDEALLKPLTVIK